MKKIAILLIAALAAAACATFSPVYKQGAQAELNKQYDEAIAFYQKAALENPKEPVYRLALERARISASFFHLQEARKLVANGQRDAAAVEYGRALALNPRDTQTALEARQMTITPPKEEAAKPEKIEFPIKLKGKDALLQARFGMESSLRSIFSAVGKSAGISILFDENFRDIPYGPDLSNQTLEGALKVLCQATKNFYRIIDERTVIIVPDQPLKRAQYEVSAIRTFYLSNLVAQDVFAALSAMLRTQYAAPNIIFDKNLNSVTIRGTAPILEQADKLLRLWDKAKAEVVIDVEIMEVSRTKLRQLGLSFSQNQVGLRYDGGTSSATDASSSWFALKGLGLGQTANYSLNLPGAFVQFLETDADTRIIAQPRLRGVSDEKITDKVGQKVPMPQTTFSPFAAGGISSQPLTSYTQQDVGIELNLTPRVHREMDVSLELEIKVSSIGGKGYADIPIINNRELKSTVRLKDGETQLIAGLLRDEERKSLKGIPGLKDIPGLGRLFSAEDTTVEQSDVIMTITPYIIRSLQIGPDDTKPVWLDIDTTAPPAAGGLLEEEGQRDPEALDAQRAEQRRRAADSASNLVAINPATAEVRMGGEFRMAVNVRSAQDIGAMSVTVSYNPRLVSLKDVAESGMTRSAGSNAPFLKNIDNAAGVCTLGFTAEPGKGSKGGGVLALLQFEAKSAGEAAIVVAVPSAMSAAGSPLSFQTTNARVVVR
jgi:general secretion pathway protein D